jgi:flagellin
MAISVNNPSNAALIALQDLANTQNQLNQTQNIVSSGVSVADAKDNPAIWSIAQNQQAQVTGLDAVIQSLNRATSVSDVAVAAGQTVITLLNQLKQDALTASEPSLDAASRQASNSDFQSTLAQITSTIKNASFDGSNLLDGSATSNLGVLASADGSAFLTLNSTDLSLGGAVLTVAPTASLGTPTLASSVLSDVNNALANVTTAIANLGVQAQQISTHNSFIGQLSDSLQSGVGDLVNANMGAESAKLQALQVQQQLGAQSLSIANQAPTVILSLFR